MNVEIGAEAAQFPEKEYINGIAVAVHTYSSVFFFERFYPKKELVFTYINENQRLRIRCFLVFSAKVRSISKIT
jgi:hypothetical protein